MPNNNILNSIEAVLFASGKPLSPATIMDIMGENSKRRITSGLKSLKETYDKSGCSLMVIEQDGLWKLTVREEYLPIVRKIVSDTELPKSVLETLAVIAWKSPVVQSEVIKVRTNKAYEHIEQLENLGFINKKKEGRSYRLSLSEKFFEYFDVRNGDIKTMFKDSKGIEKELENEQKRHIEEKGQEESPKQHQHDDDIKEAIDAEKPHLGQLEVVDSINDPQPESIEVVDVIDNDDDDQTSKDVKEVDEIIDEVDEDEKAKKEFEEIEEEAMSEDRED